jgi:ABC-type multidrug transport system ATPase subunit
MERRVITLRGVRFAYGKGSTALDCESIDIDAGLTLLLGRNGAGKSTLLKIVAGVEHPTSGSVSVAGVDLWRNEAEARRRIAYIPEHPDLTPYATLTEVMRLVCSLREVPLAEGVRALEQAGLGEHGERTVRELSMGQRRRAMLAAALVGDLDTLLFDEPLEAMDRAMREWIVDWIARAAARRGTVVVATHDVEPFAAMAARAVVVEAGIPRVIDPLPNEPAERLELLDAHARRGH